MDSLLWNVFGSLLARNDAGRDRRRVAVRRALECDAPEGRQTLSTGMIGSAGGAGLGHFRGGPAALRHHGMARQGGAHHLARGGRLDALGNTMPFFAMPPIPATRGGQPMSTPTPQSPANSTSTPATGSSTTPATGSSTTPATGSSTTPATGSSTTPATGSSTTPATGSSTTPATDSSTTPATGSSTSTMANPTPQGTLTPASQAPSNPAPQFEVNPGSQAPAAPNPKVAADFQKLQTDMHAIFAKSQVTVADMVAMGDDLKAIDKAATSAPSQATIQALQTDVNSLQGALPTSAQQTQLASDFTALVQSRGVTDTTLINKTINDAETILTASGLTSTDVSTIAADHKQIQTDLGASAPSSSSSQGASNSQGVPMDGIGDLLGLGDSFRGLLGGGSFAGPQGPGSFRGLGRGSVSAASGGPRGGWMSGTVGGHALASGSIGGKMNGATGVQTAQPFDGTGGPLGHRSF